MSPSPHPTARAAWTSLLALSLGTWLVVTLFAVSARADATAIPLGTAQSFSVLAGSTITNTGTTVVDGSIGVSPGTAITGADTMEIGGAVHAGDAVAASAQTDLTAAYNNAANQTPPIAADPELGGETLVGGIYNRAAGMALTGILTLDGQNNPDSVWVFQAGSTLTTSSGSSVVLINGADPCRVFWQVGSSATLGTGSRLVGTVMADQSITLQSNAQLEGRALARVGAVTLDSNVISFPACGPVGGAAPVTTVPPSSTPPTSTPPSTTVPPSTAPPSSTPPSTTPPPSTAPPSSTPPSTTAPGDPDDGGVTGDADGDADGGGGTGDSGGGGIRGGDSGFSNGAGGAPGNGAGGGAGDGAGGGAGDGGGGGAGGGGGGGEPGDGAQIVDQPVGGVAAGTAAPQTVQLAPTGLTSPGTALSTEWWVMTTLLGGLALLAAHHLLRLRGTGPRRGRHAA